MKKAMWWFLILLIVSVLFFSAAMAADSVSFSFKDRTTSCWGTSESIQRKGNNWNITITSITNHGVGRVFRASDYAWGSGLYTYGPNSTGKRAAKNTQELVAAMLWCGACVKILTIQVLLAVPVHFIRK